MAVFDVLAVLFALLRLEVRLIVFCLRLPNVFFPTVLLAFAMVFSCVSLVIFAVGFAAGFDAAAAAAVARACFTSAGVSGSPGEKIDLDSPLPKRRSLTPLALFLIKCCGVLTCCC